MGFLLKIALLAVAAYGVWTVARRWYGILGGGTAKTPPPAPERREAAPPPGARRAVVEDTHPCLTCGAYVSISAPKCGRSDCPQT
jgi:hypothetical protein